jgi:H+/Cl- antiporter ClcA
MNPKSDYPSEKKLAISRRILWFCFGGITLILVGTCVMTWISMINSPFIAELIIPTVVLLAVLGIFGAVCLGIYYIIRNQLEKDEELFL